MLLTGTNPEKNYWMGADGFTWWTGQVQGDGAKKLNKDGTTSPYKDETASNRVKVRIIGYHTSKHDELSVEDLPWAQVMLPATASQSSGFGTIHQLALGSWVIGFFFDGLNCQQPIVMGVIGDIYTGEQNKAFPGKVLSDNPNLPGFNNVLHPLYDNRLDGSNIGSGIPAGANPQTNAPGSGAYCLADYGQQHNEQTKVSVANGKCGTDTADKLDQTLGDMFKFLSTVKKIDELYINKYTGKVIDFLGKIQGFIGRIQNIVGDILGSIKKLITKKVKKIVRNLLNSILNPLEISLLPAKELSTKLLNLLICLIDNILDSLESFIENLIVGLVENVVNAAFCLIQSTINSILSAVNSAISGGLQAIQGIVSLIAQGGSLIANLASSIETFLATLCSGFNCNIDVSRYDTKTGVMEPRNLFGSNDAIINTDFLNVDSPQIFDADGKLVTGSLNCSQDNLGIFPCIPQIALLGLNGDAGIPRIIPIIDSLGKIISTIIQDPGNNITTNPTAIVTSCNGYGSGAEVSVVVTNGMVTDVIINNQGNGYPNFQNNVANIDLTKAIPADSSNYTGVIIGFTVTNTGSGYDDTTKILVDGYECAVPNITDGYITSVVNNCSNRIITQAPSIQIFGVGTGAVIVPIIKYVPKEESLTLVQNYNVPIEIIDCPGHPQGN